MIYTQLIEDFPRHNQSFFEHRQQNGISSKIKMQLEEEISGQQGHVGLLEDASLGQNKRSSMATGESFTSTKKSGSFIELVGKNLNGLWKQEREEVTQSSGNLQQWAENQRLNLQRETSDRFSDGKRN